MRQPSRLVACIITGTIVLKCGAFAWVSPCSSFSITRSMCSYNDVRSLSRVNLVPISKFASDINFLSKSDDHRCNLDALGRLESDNEEIYELCLVEEDDLPDLSRFVIDAFDSDTIALSTDLSKFEREFFQPAVNILNGYSGLVAYAEVLSGLRGRLKGRLRNLNISPPRVNGMSREEKLVEAARTSLVLALAKQNPDSNWHIDVIASVELRLQPCDAKIPFSWPWVDKIERNIAAKIGVGSKDRARDLQPYLSNLCVDEKFRRKSIGKALVRCVEDIATTTWGYSKLYLHVDLENKAALNLYKNEGYNDVGERWNPFWAGKAATIGYFVKTFS